MKAPKIKKELQALDYLLSRAYSSGQSTDIIGAIIVELKKSAARYAEAVKADDEARRKRASHET